MELVLWQYICAVPAAVVVAAGIVKFVKGIFSKILSTVTWIFTAGFLLTQYFQVI